MILSQHIFTLQEHFFATTIRFWFLQVALILFHQDCKPFLTALCRNSNTAVFIEFSTLPNNGKIVNQSHHKALSILRATFLVQKKLLGLEFRMYQITLSEKDIASILCRNQMVQNF